MKNNTLTDIFFDLDHTLYDFDKNAALTFEAVFQEIQLTETADFMKYFKPINERYWSAYAQAKITQEALRYGRLKDTFTAMQLQISDKQIDYIASYFIAHLSNYNHVFDGAHDTLEELQKKYRLHIITNGPDLVQEKKMKNAQLTSYFDTVTNSEMAGVKKPHKDIFTFALRQANVKAKNALMIGDSLEADVQGGLDVGMQVIWYNAHHEENKLNVQQVQHLKELLDLL